MRRDAMPNGPEREMAIEVRDGGPCPLFKVQITFKAEVEQPDLPPDVQKVVLEPDPPAKT
jgi:hypothetical protein